MATVKSELLPIACESDVVLVRHQVRKWCAEMSLSLVEQTKMITAASELARNVLVHGGGGRMRAEILQEGLRNGLRLHFEDEGKGIADIEMALRDGYTTGGGLGLGLGGSRRLVGDFEVVSRVGEGTRVTITKWK